MIIDCISDLHGFYPKLEGGDLLIVAGDLTGRDTVGEWQNFGFWMHKQQYKHKVWIAGNHDGIIERNREFAREFVCGAHYLQDEAMEINGLKIYGSPWTPEFCNWHFMKPRGDQIRAVWDKIPEDTDILITHGPPYGILDCPFSIPASKHDRCGCVDLREVVERIKPKLHVFGHIHGGYGELALKHNDAIKTQTWCVNAALMNEDYRPLNKPIRVTL